MASPARTNARLLILAVVVIGGIITALTISASHRDDPGLASRPQFKQEAPLDREEREGGSREPLVEETERVDQPRSSVEAGGAQTPARELSDLEWRQRWLSECAAELDSANEGNAEQRVEHALVTSIATIMDAAGTSRKRPEGETLHLKPFLQPGSQFFFHNESYYSFRVGEFPDYDALSAYRVSHEQWVDGKPRLSEGPEAVRRWQETEPQFPMDLVSQAKTRTAQALAILR